MHRANHWVGTYQYSNHVWWLVGGMYSDALRAIAERLIILRADRSISKVLCFTCYK